MAKSQRTENINLITFKVLRVILFLFGVYFLNSCSEKYESPSSCVFSFIKSAEEHDMTKAWNSLGLEARDYYNDLGIKNRKSGKGILEHDISEIKRFRKINNEYRIINESPENYKITLITLKNDSLKIETILENGSYKIKDAVSVRNIIRGIADELIKKEYY